MIKHTQKLFAFVILACGGLFLGANSALAEIYPNQVMPLTGDSINLPNVDCSISSLGIPAMLCLPLSDSEYTTMLLDPAGYLFGLGVVSNYGTAGTNANCDSAFGMNYDFSVVGNYNLTCFDIRPEEFGLNYNPMDITVFDPNPPVISTTTSATSTLDIIMPKVVTTFTAFLENLFVMLWPFILAFAVVASFASIIAKALNKWIK